uniref:Uncharacterized protein n=1 Tax=Emiliania huxleyi TaxID=2903 RepID=A0A7S3WGX7_EMIHU
MTTTAPAETVPGKADETLTVPEDEDKSQAEETLDRLMELAKARGPLVDVDEITEHLTLLHVVFDAPRDTGPAERHTPRPHVVESAAIAESSTRVITVLSALMIAANPWHQAFQIEDAARYLCLSTAACAAVALVETLQAMPIVLKINDVNRRADALQLASVQAAVRLCLFAVSVFAFASMAD